MNKVGTTKDREKGRNEGAPGRPVFSISEAVELLTDRFGLHGTLTKLPSDRDQNFLVSADDGHRFVFKISNADENPVFLQAQEKALRLLKTAHLPVPELFPTVTGDTLSSTGAGSGGGPGGGPGVHLLRLVSYLDGTPMAEVHPRTRTLFNQLGAVLAEIDTILAGFEDPSVHRDFAWDVLRAHETVLAHREFITDQSRRQLLDDFRLRFENEILPRAASLPHQIIHGDANDYNVLIADLPASGQTTALERTNRAVSDLADAASAETSNWWERSISGIIDFGDLIYTVRCAEVAIAASYSMMGVDDPIAILCSITAGYHGVAPLSDDEIASLVDLVRARLCISVSMSARQKRDEPENDYLTMNEVPAWELLEKLNSISTDLATYRIRAVCGLEAFPGNSRLVSWLRAERDTFRPITDPDPRGDRSLVFDFSVGTVDWKPDDMMNPLVAAKRIAERLGEDAAQVGVGRYNEARLVYAGEQFGTPGSEMRTIHIGLDLFLDPEAPVFAPLAGTVQTVQNRQLLYDYGPVVVLKHAPEDGPVFFTLYGHLNAESVAPLREGQRIDAGQLFARIGSPEENGGWVPHVHFQIIGDLLDTDGVFIGVALPSQRSVWTSLCPDPNLIAGIPADRFPDEPLGSDEILRLRGVHLSPSLSLSYRKPLHFVRGFMQHLFEPDGTAFLDAVNNVPHVGHSHPRVVQAAAFQMRTLNTNTRYLHENIVRYASRLAATMPDPLSVVYLVNSGSEANDLALRLARVATGGARIITVEGAYHGNLSSLVDISPYKYDAPGGMGAPASTTSVPIPDPFRGAHRGQSAETGRLYAESVEKAASMAARAAGHTAAHGTGGLAAFICESALGCGGQIFLPDTYLELAFAAVRAHGGVCIADEVQVGMGRLGSHFWGFQTHNVVPDIVTVGKPVGNGHPLGAVVTTRDIADAFDNGMEYFNTFGGNPVSSAVGLAVLDVIEDENLQENARLVGRHLLQGLESLAPQHEIIGDVRGQGLFLGIELVRSRESLEPAAQEATYVVNRLREEHILTSTDGPLHNVIKIKPPMVFSSLDADRLTETLARILKEDPVH